MTYTRLTAGWAAKCDWPNCAQRFTVANSLLTEIGFREALYAVSWRVRDDYDHPVAATFCPGHARPKANGMPVNGMFIVIEGADGAGKTTHAKKLATKLRDMGGDVELTSEPTKNRVGKMIRELLKTPDAHDWRAMALLFAADRRGHAGDVILPALAEGKTVISDRYYLSTMVYQTAALFQAWRALGDQEDQFKAKCSALWAFQGAASWIATLGDGLPKPDLTIVLDAPYTLLAARLATRSERDVFEEDAAFLRAAVDLYKQPWLFPLVEPVEIVKTSETEYETAGDIFAALLRRTKDQPR